MFSSGLRLNNNTGNVSKAASPQEGLDRIEEFLGPKTWQQPRRPQDLQDCPRPVGRVVGRVESKRAEHAPCSFCLVGGGGSEQRRLTCACLLPRETRVAMNVGIVLVIHVHLGEEQKNISRFGSLTP